MQRKRIIAISLALLIALSGCAPKKDPLLEAAQNGDVNAVKALLDAGGNVNHKDETGRTLLTYAALNNHKEVAQVLLDKGADVNAHHGRNGIRLRCAGRTS